MYQDIHAFKVRVCLIHLPFLGYRNVSRLLQNYEYYRVVVSYKYQRIIENQCTFPVCTSNLTVRVKRPRVSSMYRRGSDNSREQREREREKLVGALATIPNLSSRQLKN